MNVGLAEILVLVIMLAIVVGMILGIMKLLARATASEVERARERADREDRQP